MEATKQIGRISALMGMDAARIRDALGPNHGDVDVRVAREVDSTNLRMKELARAGRASAPCLLAAESQTAGRGRLGRGFVSPPGGLYMSLLLPPPPDGAPERITLLSAVAVCRAVEEFLPIRLRIKWVNDVFLEDGKVCGILAESAGPGIVTGIGVNLLPPPGGYPPEAGAARALEAALPKDILAGRIAAHILEGLPQYPDVLREYRERMFLNGRTVRYTENGQTLEGVVTGVSEDGSLLVTGPEGEKKLRSGEVTLGSHSLSRLE